MRQTVDTPNSSCDKSYIDKQQMRQTLDTPNSSCDIRQIDKQQMRQTLDRQTEDATNARQTNSRQTWKSLFSRNLKHPNWFKFEAQWRLTSPCHHLLLKKNISKSVIINVFTSKRSPVKTFKLCKKYFLELSFHGTVDQKVD